MQTKIKLGKSRSISFMKLPFDFFENHFQKLSPNTTKIYLYLLYLCTLGEVEINENEIAKKLMLAKKDISECYKELIELGLLVKNSETDGNELVNLEEFYKSYAKSNILEAKKEVKDKVKTVNNDVQFKKKIEFIEDVYGKELTPNDMMEIDSILTEHKVPYDVLICAIEYSLSKKIKSFNYISKIAINWKELGLTNYESCEKYISEESLSDEKLYYNIKHIFNLKRELYDVEIKYIDDWYYNKNKTLDDIKKAFETTVLNTGKLSFPYMNTILTNDKSSSVNKTIKKKNDLNNFTEREYDSTDVLTALRKKQNGWFSHEKYEVY